MQKVMGTQGRKQRTPMAWEEEQEQTLVSLHDSFTHTHMAWHGSEKNVRQQFRSSDHFHFHAPGAATMARLVVLTQRNRNPISLPAHQPPPFDLEESGPREGGMHNDCCPAKLFSLSLCIIACACSGHTQATPSAPEADRQEQTQNKQAAAE